MPICFLCGFREGGGALKLFTSTKGYYYLKKKNLKPSVFFKQYLQNFFIFYNWYYFFGEKNKNISFIIMGGAI